jgi:hypothetical protein
MMKVFEPFICSHEEVFRFHVSVDVPFNVDELNDVNLKEFKNMWATNGPFGQ